MLWLFLIYGRLADLLKLGTGLTGFLKPLFTLTSISRNILQNIVVYDFINADHLSIRRKSHFDDISKQNGLICKIFKDRFLLKYSDNFDSKGAKTHINSRPNSDSRTSTF